MKDGKQEPEDKAKDTEIDKDRQRADIEAANAARARAERDTAKAELLVARQAQENRDAEMERLKSERDRLAAETNASKALDDILPDIDPDEASVEDLARVAIASKKVVADLKNEISTLKAQAAAEKKQTEAERQAAQAKASQDREVNKLMSRLEKKYGAGYRNASIEMFEAKQRAGEITGDMTPVDVAMEIEDCYETCAKKKKKDGSSHATTDPLSGGSPRPSYTKPTIKPGSLEDVREQYAQIGQSP